MAAKRKATSSKGGSSGKKEKLSVAEERKRAREWAEQNASPPKSAKKAGASAAPSSTRSTRRGSTRAKASPSPVVAPASPEVEEDSEVEEPISPKRSSRVRSPTRKAAEAEEAKGSKREEARGSKRSSRRSDAPPAMEPPRGRSTKSTKRSASTPDVSAAPGTDSAAALFPFDSCCTVSSVAFKTIKMFIALAAAWFIVAQVGYAPEPNMESVKSAFIVLVMLFAVPFALSAVPAFAIRYVAEPFGTPVLYVLTAAVLFGLPKYGLCCWPGVKMLKGYLGL